MNFTENHLNLLRNVLLFTLHPSVLARNAGKDPTLTVLRNLGAAPGFGVDHLSTSELEKKVASDLFKISRKKRFPEREIWISAPEQTILSILDKDQM